MKGIYKSILSTLLLLPAYAQATTYKIDPTHANVKFAIDHFGTSTNTGGFYNLTGNIEYDPKAETGYVDITIPIASLNTGNATFDATLLSGDFFAVTEHPTARFVSTKWDFVDVVADVEAVIADRASQLKEVARVEGMLTLNDKTQPVTLTATKFNCYFSPIHRAKVCGGDFVSTIDRTHWGIDKYVMMGMTKYVTLNIQIEAIKQ